MEIGLGHFPDKGIKVDLALPAQLLLGFGGVAVEEPRRLIEDEQRNLSLIDLDGDSLDFGGTEVCGVDADNDVAGFNINTLFINTSALPPRMKLGQS